MALSILGIGTVTALGSGVETLQQGFEGNIVPNIEKESIQLPAGEIQLSVYKAAIEGLDRFIDKRALRRIDRFAQIALLSTYLAVENSGIELTDPSRVGVIFGSSYGPTRTTFKFLDNIIDDGDFGASPTHFANSVHNALASQVSIFMKFTGPCSTVTCFEHTLSNVLLTAQNWLDDGICDYVLAGLGDEYCNVLGYAAAKAGAGKTDAVLPESFDQCSYLPGEGHITFLLGKEDENHPQIKEIKIRQNPDRINKAGLLKNKVVFFNANGWKAHNEAFTKIDFNQSEKKSVAHLIGSIPVSAAFDIAVAALQKGRGESICLEYCDQNEFNLYNVQTRDCI
jgi:3-oxoacyl-[acyl-carrier-protein] synthase II